MRSRSIEPELAPGVRGSAACGKDGAAAAAAERWGTRDIARDLDTTPTTIARGAGALRAQGSLDLKTCRVPAPHAFTVQKPRSALEQSLSRRHLT